jgi:hypothetical protein
MSESSFVQFAQGVDHRRGFGSTTGDLRKILEVGKKHFCAIGNTFRAGVTMAKEAVHCAIVEAPTAAQCIVELDHGKPPTHRRS